jgi:signal transduction histidine kinase
MTETVYSNIGNTYLGIKNFNLAKEYLKRAIKTETGKLNPENYYRLARFYFETNDLSLSLGYLRRAIRLAKQYDITLIETLSLLMVGDICYRRNEHEKALLYAEMVLVSYKEFKHPQLLFQTPILFAKIYTALDNLREAKKYYNEFLNIQTSCHDNKLLLSFYDHYIDYCYRIKDLGSANLYLRKYIEVKDRVYSRDLEINTDYMSQHFEAEKEKKELELYHERNNQLKKIIEVQDNVMNMISHDLKNYLGTISLSLETMELLNEELSENKYIKKISASTNLAIGLVKEILSTSKAEIENQDENFTKNDMNKILTESKENFIDIAMQKNINVVYDLYPEAVICNLNYFKFIRIIDNLFINAVKFTYPEGNIIIKTRKIGNFAHLHIIDNGLGMSECVKEHLFMKFSKSGRVGTAGEESTGLGLYIVKQLIELHNGEIDVKSEVGKGTEFIIKIPLSI